MQRFQGLRAGATLLAVASMAVLSAAAQAQAFPTKPVRIVVPYTSGGGTDTVARGVAQKLSEIWGHPVVVENRPGGATMIGADHVAKSPADGYTLLFSDSAALAITPALYPKMPYNPLTDLAPLTIVCRLAPVIAISNDIPVRNAAEFIAWGKANPGKLSYGSFGSGSYPHVVTEQLKRMAGIEMLHVPYKGSAPAVTDIIGGRLSMLIVTLSVFEQHEKAGKLRVVATTTKNRLTLRPDLPTVAESGVPGYDVDVWFGMSAPAATPVPVLDRIWTDVARVLKDPDFRDKFLKAQSLEPGGETREEFAQIMRADTARWARLVKESGAKVD